MLPQEFKYLNELIKGRSGIDLKEDKLYLFESRLLPIASKHGHKDLSSFVGQMMRSLPPEAMIQEIIEAMTTNESMFFRDNKPFQHLKEVVLAELKAKAPSKPVHIWCSACSSGQEPYSIAMLADENRNGVASMGVQILATDIDTQIINKAKEGVYNQFEVQRGLPMQLLLKYFKQLPDNRWQLIDAVRNVIQFKQHNLLKSARHHGQFDIVFCRNVLIYFDDTTKKQVLQNIAEVMPVGGYLFLGSAETMPVGFTMFRPHHEQRQIYIRQ